jgi:uncharacterized lipoprotein YajG
MKRIINALIPGLLALVLLAGCEKDENRITFEGGTAPVLKASAAGPFVLVPANASTQAITFSWTNPNYNFSTGVNSQDVTYVLQVDTTGANFTSPTRQEISIARDLLVNYTVKEFNGIFSRMNLQENMPHNIEYRIKSTLTNGSVPLYSNVIKQVVTPYLDVVVPIPPTGQLFITGDGTASGWTNNPPTTQKFTKVSNTEFYIVMNLTPGFFYKFLSTSNQWQPQYGGNNASGGDMGYNMGTGSDPDAIPTPAIAGTYKITANFKTGKYTVVKQ